MRAESVVDRFWRKVKIGTKDECWWWTAHTVGGGYGHIRSADTMVLAHRISWVIHRGEIPKKQYVLHKCDNRRCVNPDHLFLGTQKDNMEDCVKKGRLVRYGEHNSHSVVTEADVLDIRRKHSMGMRKIVLAGIYGITRSQISRIVRKVAWRYIK